MMQERRRSERSGPDQDTTAGSLTVELSVSHVPMLDDRKNRRLADCGAWTRPVNGCRTAIAEMPEGRLRLLRWPACRAPASADQAPPMLRLRERDSARLIRHIHALRRSKQPCPRLAPQRPLQDKPISAMPRFAPGVMHLP